MAKSPASPIDKILGANLNRFRTTAGLSRESLGQQCGLTFQQIAKYEHGVNRISSAKLVEMASILGVEVVDMMEGVAEALPPQQLRNRADLNMMKEYNQLPSNMRATVRELVDAMARGLAQKKGALR